MATEARLPNAGFPLTRMNEMSLSLAANEFIKVSPCGVSWAEVIKGS